MTRHWFEFDPTDAVDVQCKPDGDVLGPLNENGDMCPWPWEPQQLKGQPIGQYHCRYCGAMVLAGMPHLDYRDAL